ncbi:MAG: AraC family transcriptional regulator [Pedobacter sp.]|nr:MAG: AraC family transcriptional regulator [Pedobacter sp.]
MLDLQHVKGNIICDFYAIAIKKGVDYELRYGQNRYDFDEGVMSFIAPNQVIKVEGQEIDRSKASGWILLIHPDFLWNSALATGINKYEYFNYSVHEALFLSDKEETIVNNLIENIQQEYNNNIDKFSQHIILSQIETLLNYADRFYQRQFITRKKANHQILERLETLLNNYFAEDNLSNKGIPTVQYLATSLNVSTSYLGSLLKTLTGQSTQQLIQEKLIEKAKEKLSTTNLTVSEIAFQLGFEHSQSFSKLFKSKTTLSPLGFRQSFN